MCHALLPGQVANMPPHSFPLFYQHSQGHRTRSQPHCHIHTRSYKCSEEYPGPATYEFPVFFSGLFVPAASWPSVLSGTPIHTACSGFFPLQDLRMWEGIFWGTKRTENTRTPHTPKKKGLCFSLWWRKILPLPFPDCLLRKGMNKYKIKYLNSRVEMAKRPKHK